MKKSIPLTHVCATGARPRGSSSREVTRAERGADDRSWTLRILKLEGSTCSNGSYSRRELRIWVEGSPESSWKEPKVKGILEASRMEPGVKGSSDSKALQSRRPFRREGCKMGRGAKSRVIINMWLGSKQRQNCLQKYTRNIFTNLGLQRLEIGYHDFRGFLPNDYTIWARNENKTNGTVTVTIGYDARMMV